MGFSSKKLQELAVKWWPLVALAVIFIFAFYIRSVNITPDRILSFDPIFQYRYTKYLADFGTLPVWDELTYYVGRFVTFNESPPLLWFLTVVTWWILKGFGISLMTSASYISALLGAAVVVPAFLLGRELSNKWGGLLAAVLLGTAPQILIRTFAASFDTDQIAILFIVLTLWAGFYALKKRTPASFCLAAGSFIGFMMAWGMYLYTWFFLIAGIMVYFVVASVLGDRNIIKDNMTKPKMNEKFMLAWKHNRGMLSIITALFVTILLAGSFVKVNVLSSIAGLTGFARQAELWIVNISIAELQSIDLTSLGTWMVMMGRFITGNTVVDILLFLTFISLAIFGLWQSSRHNTLDASFLLTLFGLGVLTTFRGIRFTEFSSALILIVIAAGWGYLINWTAKDKFLRPFAFGLGLLVVVIAAGLSLQLAPQLGPDVDPNWDSAWTWIQQNTPETSLIGTWWDPGHMIAGIAERRNIADGAHCGNTCLWNINDRITDLGFIMATSNETASVERIQKYQGTSEKVYWIASNDLIGKFQWVQFFGTGCDARYEERCALYNQVSLSQYGYGQDGGIAARYYSNIIIMTGSPPIPFVVEGRNAAVFNEVISYESGVPKATRFSDYNISDVVGQLKPLETQLNAKFTNTTAPQTIWISPDQSYIVIIPPTLRENVFTKMFMLEGQGLSHFKQVFRNEAVKIYEVI